MQFLLLLKKYWGQVLTGIAILFLLVSVAIFYDRCKSHPKIDTDTVQKINSADQTERKEELKKTLEENAGVIDSTRENTKLTDLSNEEKEKEIQQKIEEADKKISEAKEQGRDVTQEELECILVPKNCQ